MSVSIVIAEDHALFRSGLKQLIGIEPGWEKGWKSSVKLETVLRP